MKIYAFPIYILAIYICADFNFVYATTEKLSTTSAKPDLFENMTLIGQFGSKQFFEAKVTEKVDWMQASMTCSDAKLDFAKLDNADEFNFIYEQRKGNDYWISAAMKGISPAVGADNTLNAFQYSDGSPVPVDINFEHESKFWLCLYVAGDHHTLIDYCIKSKHQVLCQQKM